MQKRCRDHDSRSAMRRALRRAIGVSEMDRFVLSLKMKEFTAWLDGRCQPKTLARKQFEGPPFGSSYVTIDPGRQAAFPSANMNRVYLCGTEPGMDSGSIGSLIDLFKAE